MDSRELTVKILGDASDFVKATGDVTKGTDDAKSGLASFADGSKKAAVVLAGVGVGLTAYAKSATDFTTTYVLSTRELSRNTGMTVEQSSQLISVATKLGISTDQAATTFGIFSKRIQAATDAQTKNTLAQRDAELQIQQTQIALNKNNDELAKNQIAMEQNTAQIKKSGDATGALANQAKLLKDQHDQLSLTSQQLTNKIADLKSQINDAKTSFDKLGISVTDSTGKQKDFNTLLLETADKFKAMQDGSQKTTIAMDLFGRSGKDLIVMLNQGSKGIQQMEDQANKLGLTLTQKNVASVMNYIKAQSALKESTDALKLQIGELTSPVLAAFDQKVNKVVTSLLSSHSPFHTATVDILAFGGPVATAASGFIAFTANLAQTIEALGGFRLALAATAAFMVGPWGLAIAGLGIGLAIVGSHLFEQKSMTEQLRIAQESLKTATDNLKASQDQLSGAQLNLEGAQLAVQQAQLNYNDAVAQFGPKSLQAQQALHDLKQAQFDLQQAQDASLSSLQNLKNKQDEVAKDKALIQHLQETASNLKNVGDNAFNAGQQIERINGSKVTVKTTKGAAGNQVIDFSSTFGGGLPHNAQGTDNWQGGLTWVGEKGPEIINAPKGSQIIPADKSKQLANQSGQANVNLTVQVGMYAGMPVEKRQIALELYKELVRAARSQGVSLPMIGAVGVQ